MTVRAENVTRPINFKVSQQIAVLKRMKKMLPIETRRDLYLAFILPHFNYHAVKPGTFVVKVLQTNWKG